MVAIFLAKREEGVLMNTVTFFTKNDTKVVCPIKALHLTSREEKMDKNGESGLIFFAWVNGASMGEIDAETFRELEAKLYCKTIA